MNYYKTNDIAKIIGIHVNTVRLYEKCGLISPPQRKNNGYRVFTEIHIEQFKLARSALQVEILQNGLRKQAVDIVKSVALGDYECARSMAFKYLQQIDTEISNAEESVSITQKILLGNYTCEPNYQLYLSRRETSEFLHITIDTLRNWELNGLITIGRKENRYRVYSYEDIQKLKIIRSLRCANYSLSSILRMLNALSNNPNTDIRTIINTPKLDEDIITACDKLITSLSDAKSNMTYVISQIDKLKQMNKDYPTL